MTTQTLIISLVTGVCVVSVTAIIAYTIIKLRNKVKVDPTIER